jgi:hypothetical protein
MIVVSNASPLVGLASIRQLDLLRQLYSKVHIPEAVWQEVVVTVQANQARQKLRTPSGSKDIKLLTHAWSILCSNTWMKANQKLLLLPSSQKPSYLSLTSGWDETQQHISD